MADYGLYVSPEGFNANTAEDKDLVFTSEAFGLKIAQSGSVDVTIPAGSANFSDHYVDIEHNLGYAPAFYAFVEDTNGNRIGINISFVDEMEESTSSLNCWALSDENKLRLIFTVVFALGTDVVRNVKYFIFAEPTT